MAEHKKSAPSHAQIKSWSKNAGKSVAYSSLEVLKSIAPTISDVTVSASEASRNMSMYLTEAKSQISRQGTSLETSKLGRSAKSVFDSAMADIRSGNFSLDRASSDALGDYDDFFDNDAGPDGENATDPAMAGLGKAVTVGTAASIDSMRESTNVIAKTQIKAAQIISDKNANVVLFGINKLNASLLGVNNQLNTINNNIVSLINFQNQNVSITNQAMLSYFDRSLGILEKLDKTLSGRDKKYSYKTGPMDFLMGGFDTSGYKSAIKKNFEDSELGSLYTMAKMMTSMGSMGGGGIRPTKMILEDFLLPALIGSDIKRSVRRADTKFNKNLKNGLYRLGDMGQDYSKNDIPDIVRRTIGQIFGIKRETVGKAAMWNFNKENMMWNGEAQKTLVEVIPSYLSRMESALVTIAGTKSRDNERYYDMSSGTFKTRKSLEGQYEKDKTNDVVYATNDTLQKINKYLEQNNVSAKEMLQYQKLVSDMIQDRVFNGGGYTKNYRQNLGKLNTRFTREQAKDVTVSLEDAIEEAVQNVNRRQRNIESGDAQVYRNLFNEERGSYNPFKTSNLYKSAYSFYGDNTPTDRYIPKLLGMMNIDPSDFKVTTEFRKYFDSARMNPNVTEDTLISILQKEYNNQKVKTGFAKVRKKVFGAGDAARRRASNGINRGVDYIDDAVYGKIYGEDSLGPSNARPTKASSRGTANLAGEIRTSGKADSRATSKSQAERGGVTTELDKQIESNIRRAPKNFKEIEKRTLSDANSSLAQNQAGMLNAEKEIPESAAENSATINGVTEATTNLAKKGSSLIGALKQTVVTMHTGAIDILSGIFGRDGLVSNIWDSKPVQAGLKKLQNKLFNEKDGVFAPFVRQMLDVGDYMKYVFNGKAYTDRKGVTHEETNNAVFKYINKGYQFIFGNTMQYLFGKDYENNEIYQKYFSWLGGKEKRAKAREAANNRKNNPQKQRSVSGRNGQLALPSGSQDTLMLPENATLNNPEFQSTALVVVPTVDENGNQSSQSFDVNDGIGIHSAVEQNYVNQASTALTTVKEGNDALSTVLLGDNKDAKQAKKSFMERFKENLPKSITAAIVGGGISMLSGGHMGPILGAFLPGGIVGGAIVGMGVQLLSRNKAVNKFLFGEFDEKTQEKTGGVINQKMQASFKKALPTIVGGAVIGAINHGGLIAKLPGVGILASTLLPGGVLGGAILGMGWSLLHNSNTFKNILFGKEDPETGKRTGSLSKVFDGAKKFLVEASPYLKKGAKGAAIGAVSGVVLSNMGYMGAALSLGGPVGLGLLGFGMGIASQTEKFKKFMFGDEELDENGNPTGKRLKNGLMGKVEALLITDVFEPVKESMKHNMEEFAYWLRLKIADPFMQIFQPIVNQIEDIGDYIKEKVDKLADGLKVMIGGFFKKIFRPVVHLVGSVMSGIMSVTRVGLQLALSPISGALGLVKLAIAPAREGRDLKFKAGYLKGNYGDSNRSFLRRLGDVMNINRDKGAEEGSYFTAHRDYADEMRKKKKRVNDWDLITEHRNTIKERNEARKQHRESSRIIKYAQQTNKKWGYNQSVILSDDEVARMRKELTSKRYGNLNPAGLQTADQIKQLIYHKDEWMDQYGPGAEERKAKKDTAALAGDVHTRKFQSSVDSKLSTIANLLSKSLFGTAVYPEREASEAGFTMKKAAKGSEAQFNISDMNFSRIQTLGHGFQSSEKLKDMYNRMSRRQGGNLNPNDFLSMVVGSDYEEKIKAASSTASEEAKMKSNVAANAPTSNKASDESTGETNKLLGILARIQSNGKLTTKKLKSVLSGRAKFTDIDANKSGTDATEIGNATSAGITGWFGTFFKKQDKQKNKEAKIAKEQAEDTEAKSGTKAESQAVTLYNAEFADKQKALDAAKKPTKKKSLFSTIIGGVGGLVGGIFGGISSLFNPGNILNTFKNLGLAIMLGAFLKNLLKNLGGHFMNTLKEYHPKIYTFLTDKLAPFFTNTIPNVFKKFGVNIKDTLSNFKVKALDFLQNDVKPWFLNELPLIMEQTAKDVSSFITKNSATVIKTLVTVVEAVAPVVVKTLGVLVNDVYHSFTGRYIKGLPTEESIEAEANGGTSGVYNSDGTGSLSLGQRFVRSAGANGGTVARNVANTVLYPKAMAKGALHLVGNTVKVGSTVGGFVVNAAIPGLGIPVSIVGNGVGGAINKIGDVTGTLIGKAQSKATGKVKSRVATDVVNKVTQSAADIALNTAKVSGVKSLLGGYIKDNDQLKYVIGHLQEANPGMTKAEALIKLYGDNYAEKLGISALTDTSESVATSAVKSATKTAVKDTSKNFLTKILKRIGSALNSIHNNPTIVKLTKKCNPIWGALSKAFSKLVDKALIKLSSANNEFVRKLATKISARIAKNAAKDAAGVATAGIVTGLFAAADLATGAFEAASLFNCNDDVVDWKMRLISSLIKALFGLPVACEIDLGMEIMGDLTGVDIKCELATLIYNAISDEADEEALKESQDNLSKEAALYNKDHPDDQLNVSEYSTKKNKTVVGKVWNAIKSIWGGDDDTDYAAYEAAAKSSGSSSSSSGSSAKSAKSVIPTLATNATPSSLIPVLGNGPGMQSSRTKANASKVYFGPAQADPRWASYRIGTLPDGRPSTMAIGGCGPTALSTAASMLGYGPVDMSPVGIAKFAKNNGYITQGGSSSKLFTEGASKLGMHANSIGMGQIYNSIANGNPVIIAGKSGSGYGAGMGYGSPYTPAGHILTASGFDSNGNIIVNDPMTGSKASYSRNQIASGLTGAWSLSRKNSGYGFGPIGYGKDDKSNSIINATMNAAFPVLSYTVASTAAYIKGAKNLKSAFKGTKKDSSGFSGSSGSYTLNDEYPGYTGAATINSGHLWGIGNLGPNGDVLTGSEPFTTLKELYVKKYGKLGAKGSTSGNPFGLSSVDQAQLISMSTMTSKFLQKTLITDTYRNLVKYRTAKGLHQDWIRVQDLTNLYIAKSGAKYKIDFYHYATALAQLGIVRFVIKKYAKSTAGATEYKYSGKKASDVFKESDIVVTKWGLGKCGRGNFFGLSDAQMKSYVYDSDLAAAKAANVLSAFGYNTIYPYLRGESSLKKRRAVKSMTIKALSDLWSSGKISFSDYAGILKNMKIVDFTITASKNGSYVPTTYDTSSGDSSSDETSSATEEVAARVPTNTTVLGKISNLIAALGLVGNRVINSFGNEGGYQRIYDENGNILDQAFVDKFNDVMIYGNNDSDSTSSSSSTSGADAFNPSKAANLHDEVMAYAAKSIASHEGSYNSVNPNDVGSPSIGIIQFHDSSYKHKIFDYLAANAPTAELKQKAKTFGSQMDTAQGSSWGNSVKAFLSDPQISGLNEQIQNQLLVEYINSRDMPTPWGMYTSGLIHDPRAIIPAVSIGNAGSAWLTPWKKVYKPLSSRTGEIDHVADSLKTQSWFGVSSPYASQYRKIIGDAATFAKGITLSYDPTVTHVVGNAGGGTLGYGIGPMGYGTITDAGNFAKQLATSATDLSAKMREKWGIGNLDLNGNSSTTTNDSSSTSSSFGGAGSNSQRGIVTAMRSWMNNKNGGIGVNGPLKYVADGTAPDGYRYGAGKGYTKKYTGAGCCSTAVGAAYRVALGDNAPDTVYGQRHYMCANFVNAPDFTTVDASPIASTLTSSGNVSSGPSGRAPDASKLQPGDVLFYRRHGNVGHVEIYTGENSKIGHGYTNGPHEKALSVDANNFVEARRYNKFMAGYGVGPYYGVGPSSSQFNINNIHRTPGYTSTTTTYYGDTDNSTNISSTKTDLQKRISEKLNLASSTSDISKKMDTVIGVMKDWFDYSKTQSPSSNTIIANNGNSAVSSAAPQPSNPVDQNLMNIHQRISKSKV